MTTPQNPADLRPIKDAELASVSRREREELKRALAEAEAELARGGGTEYESRRFKDRLLRIYRNGRL